LGMFDGMVDDSAKVSDFSVIPAGQYELELTEGSVEPTNDGTGKLFKHRFRVIDGEYEGRLIFGNMNLVNKSDVAANIGRGEFNALRTVTGVLDIPQNELEPDNMFFKRFTGVVKIQPAKGDWEAKNAVNWGATLKLFNQGNAANDNGKAPVGKAAANDNAPATAKTKPWGNRAAA
jgi:hypothetical protein